MQAIADKMSHKQALLLVSACVIGVPLALMSVAGSAPVPVRSTAGALAVTVAELEKAYDGNEVSADQQYGDRLLAITGKVIKVALNADDEPFVSFESNGLIPFQAHFTRDDGAGTAEFAEGQDVMVYCTKVTETLGQPSASGCFLSS